ncbi:Gfo/Idh/MocA family protein [Geodermatophilus sabuli]|uniref:Predicted dehydrogenase n=1 Tax=Geodermatophilus sabuli TaxID=1564158 RepID=A0A285EKQ7_9ACTN|nr:Gfo/Idh/MocA family oxidoreductase [Geodermatophilus sabuli]MBB3083933.1 putative dehydrogenase [Geodermatophilus sabuli]SNX98581.1 Predicted dehydrogenase [Geodermatophilus sabuli]
MTVRVGLVGAGAVGARHARTLAAFDDVELVGVCDPVPAAAGALAAELGVPAVADLDRLLRAGVDAVWLCVPPFAHGDPELAAVRAGVPFFVEKPLAADLPVARRVADAVAAAGLPTATGYHWRHLDTVERARQVLGGDRVRLVDVRWWGTTPPAAWWRREDRSGGQVVEQATHVLDLVRVLAGEVTEVVGAAAPSTREARDVPDATAAVLRFRSGAVGTASTSCVLPLPTAAGLDVAAAGVSVALTETSLRVGTAEGVEEVIPTVDARRAVDRAFVDVLSGRPRAPGLVDVAEALRTHHLACAVAEAARTGAAVRVGEP